MPNEHRNPSQEERDERVALPLDPEMALRALLKVKLDDGQPMMRRTTSDNLVTPPCQDVVSKYLCRWVFAQLVTTIT